MPNNVVEPDRQAFSIVVIGDFNPAIFQPLWFSNNELVAREEAENAEIAVIHKKIASFAIGPFQVQVDESRLGLTTDESSQGPLLRDLAAGTLSILEHTPLKAIGLNLDIVFTLESDDAWHSVGDRLVPKSDWIHFLDKPGMRQLVVEGKRPDCKADHINVRVQPGVDRGTLVAINQHYQLETSQRVNVRERHREAIRAMSDDWSSFVNFARQTATTLVFPNQAHPQAAAKT